MAATHHIRTIADLKPGDKFGRLVVEAAAPTRGRFRYYLCRCICGEFREVQIYRLVSGHTRSCGCMKQDATERLVARNKTHGEGHSRLYNIWCHVVQRCTNPKARRFGDYGGRGISVCCEWRESFAAFYAWAHVSGYRDDLTIERIDNDGDYEPGNCRWATRREQNRNTRATVWLTAFGETKSLASWSEDPRCVPSYHTLKMRVKELQWDHERAITTPPDSRRGRRRHARPTCGDGCGD